MKNRMFQIACLSLLCMGSLSAASIRGIGDLPGGDGTIIVGNNI